MSSEELVSVIIPSYNRFNYLLNSIKSVKDQTYKNIEIIVVNDCSTQKEYYEHDFGDIKVVHLKKNSRNVLGFPSAGYVTNQGLKLFKGEYLAFLDDDDYWIPEKIELQLKDMKSKNCQMSCTEGYYGRGMYSSEKKYKLYNSETYFNQLCKFYKIYNLRKNGFPEIFDLNFIKIHNSIIGCSCIIHKDIIKKVGPQLEIKMGGTTINGRTVHIDYNYWLRCLEHTNCAYLNKPLIYYDGGHGDGKNY